MCGIAGIFAYHDASPMVDRGELRRIRDFMSPRGPDGSGEWFSEEGRIGLGHRRLAVIDLTTKAAQPMENEDGTLVISFNGEIYNYRQLRFDLERKGFIFRSQSDTEVLLQLYEQEGEAMVHRLRGMFALILWDSKRKIMLLIRDPYGIKPLYYADDGRTLRIASQVKALLQSNRVSRLREPAGIAGFFLTGSVPEPYTTYREIHQVPAGSIVTVNQSGTSPPRTYFSVARIFLEAVDTARTKGAKKSIEETREVTREALLDSIRHHFVSDVPVGVFLSAGVDSGVLVGLAQEVGIRNLRTITLSFGEFQGQHHDEAPLAKEVSSLYKANHKIWKLSRTEFKTELPRILKAMDQPSVDGVNTYFASKFATEMGLKVVLSGLGGDELFGGYSSFKEIPNLVRALKIPSRFPFLGDGFRHAFQIVRRHLTTLGPKYAGLLKFGGTYPGAYFLRRGLFMPWELGSVIGQEIANEGLKRLHLLDHFRQAIEPDPKTPFGRVAALEASLYMRNQLLRDTDWAGMSHSLEIRTPYIDTPLLTALAPILVSSKTPFRHPKQLLTTSVKTPLPSKVLNRSKTGFQVPFGQWLETGETLDGWRGISDLARRDCPWARRWAYTVYKNSF